MGNTAMKNGDVRVFFNNEFTAASADTHHPVAETNRPFAKLRGDLQAWTGTDDNICNEDFAIVKIEWNGGKTFVGLISQQEWFDPSFNSDNLVGKKVCTFMQYSSRLPVNSNSRTSFSTHVAMGTVLEVKQGPRTKESVQLIKITMCTLNIMLLQVVQAEGVFTMKMVSLLEFYV